MTLKNKFLQLLVFLIIFSVGIAIVILYDYLRTKNNCQDYPWLNDDYKVNPPNKSHYIPQYLKYQIYNSRSWRFSYRSDYMFILFLSFGLGYYVAFGPGFWKKYHGNKKIFCLSYYALVWDKSLYEKELSSDPQLQKLEQQIIQKDHLASKGLVFLFIIHFPLNFTLKKFFVEGLFGFEAGITSPFFYLTFYYLLRLIFLFIIWYFFQYPKRQLCLQKNILEEKIANNQSNKTPLLLTE